jgi:hypothetical protein
MINHQNLTVKLLHADSTRDISNQYMDCDGKGIRLTKSLEKPQTSIRKEALIRSLGFKLWIRVTPRIQIVR